MAVGYGEVGKAALLTEEELEQSVVTTDSSLPDNPIPLILVWTFHRQTLTIVIP